jgi:hypothetical protein
MVTLIIEPKFTGFRLKWNEAGDYVVILPLPHKDITLWKMWCSSMQWAVSDAENDFKEFLDDAFGKNNWQFKFNNWHPKDSIDNEKEINLSELVEKRAKYHLPAWETDKPDLYQKIIL